MPTSKKLLKIYKFSLFLVKGELKQFCFTEEKRTVQNFPWNSTEHFEFRWVSQMFDMFLNFPVSISVWHVMRLLNFTEFSYCKALREGDRERLLKFCEIIFGKMEVEDNFFRT